MASTADHSGPWRTTAAIALHLHKQTFHAYFISRGRRRACILQITMCWGGDRGDTVVGCALLAVPGRILFSNHRSGLVLLLSSDSAREQETEMNKRARDGNEFVCNVDCAIRMQTPLVGGVARAWGRVGSMLGVHARDLQPFVRCVPRFAPATCAHIVVQVVEGIPGIYIYQNWSNGAGCTLR